MAGGRSAPAAAGSRRVVLLGASEGGPACIKFAADHLDRVAGLILFASLAKGSAAPDYPHGCRPVSVRCGCSSSSRCGAGPAGIETIAPSLVADPQARAWWAGMLRAASSRGAIKGVLEALRDTDATAPRPPRRRAPTRTGWSGGTCKSIVLSLRQLPGTTRGKRSFSRPSWVTSRRIWQATQGARSNHHFGRQSAWRRSQNAGNSWSRRCPAGGERVHA
jgi:pimeloyl-ACP methyl ester carboxylesterase